MPTTRRCIFGCQTTGVAIHTFPQPTKYPNRFKIWVKLAGDLLKDLSDEEIYHRKRICDIHFLPQHKTRNNRLSTIAVPSLQLPGTATENVVSPLLDAEISPTSSHYEIDFSNSTVVQPGEMAQWDTKGKTFLITGGASGLGAQYAQAFLEHGAKNVAILDIAEELGAATAERLNTAHGNKAVFIKCDVSKEEDIARAFDAVLAHFKQIDVIINNAGVMVDAPATWRTATDVNYQGVVSFTLKGVEYMRKDKGGLGGTIINIASTAAITKVPALPVYCGAKMAVLHFSQCLAEVPFYDNTGIRVLTICFGLTDTPLLHNLEEKAYERKAGEALANMVVTNKIKYQKPASAVAAMVQMFKAGAPGSIWFSNANKPVIDITPVIGDAFIEFRKLMLP
ncbi:hypothetical protein PYW07_002721 [Mythimna separata]|uniref:THAP-type domain-containing protein n=1 Tax=Mythimna separata TaxID=271217 RepID=A0AAD7YFT8_MYTSE|nr:hypothetical protein PYW07_002721 [Mythimna separata]